MNPVVRYSAYIGIGLALTYFLKEAWIVLGVLIAILLWISIET